MDILAADIGGTNARFAVVSAGDDSTLRLRHPRILPSTRLPAPAEAVRSFLADTGARVDAVALAVAGPVVDGTGALTNLRWTVHAAELAAALPCTTVRVLNDFEALGRVLPALEDDDVTTIQAGAPVSEAAPMALLGAGTGLGQALVVPHPTTRRLHVVPTEGGHASFAPRTEVEWALRAYLSERHGGHVSWERILSGAGLVAVYEFLVDSGRASPDETTRTAMIEMDPAVVVVKRGLDGTDPACARALDLMVAVYGACAGNLALSTGALGGVYLAGGITLGIRARLESATFLDAFRDKGRFSAWAGRVPVKIIDRDDAGLLGAALTVLPDLPHTMDVTLPDRWGRSGNG